MERIDTERYERAKQRMEEIKGFYWHLFAICLATPIVVVINYLTTDFPWSLFPIGAFLLSIAIHWFAVFKRGSFFTRQWEEKKIREFMDEDSEEQKRLYY